MSNTKRFTSLKKIKKQINIKESDLQKTQATLRSNNFCKLLENDLEQAKLILAAKDVLDKLQKIAEHLAEIGAEDIMPISDNMKGVFGPDIAQQFEHSANENIQHALETVRNAKDAINDAILRVEGKVIPKTDMNSPDDKNEIYSDM